MSINKLTIITKVSLLHSYRNIILIILFKYLKINLDITDAYMYIIYSMQDIS